MFYTRREKNFGATVLAKTVAPKDLITKIKKKDGPRPYWSP